MKLIHLSDLHIGKKVNEYSMLEDQQDIFIKIINIIDEQEVEGVLIAGDVYDKSMPSNEAVELFDDFLVRLAQRKLKVFVISGNHDSAQRIAFGAKLMHESGIYMSPVYRGKVEPITLNDAYGELNIYMLPFIKPSSVRNYFEEEITSYTQAVKLTIDQMNIDTQKRNILITHQFVTGAMTSDSEEMSVGGSDNVDASVFEGFDYVALGHIHRPQKCGSEYIRYSGTPLKYSFSEANHQKSVTILEVKAKGNIELSFIPLIPKHDLVEIKGTFEELTNKAFYENTTYQDDYMHITLTNEDEILDALNKLRVIYKNIMKLDYDNSRTRHYEQIHGAQIMKNKTPLEYFNELYELQNGLEMNEEQKAMMNEFIEDIWGNKI